MKLLSAITAVAALVVLSGTVFASPQKSSTPASAAQVPAVQGSEPEPTTISGKIVETKTTGDYTYALVQKNGKKTWVAVPKTELKVGQEVTFRPGYEMTNFPSKSLNRTFESIIFSAGLVEPAGKAGEKDQKPAAESPGSKGAAAATTEKISVPKAEGRDAYTIGEVFSKSAKLNKKKVTIKAKVVKVSTGIMGKNWIHLQDGTGEAGRNFDLVATSQDSPNVGDIITVKGTIYKDKDFGSGYRYSVIMEDAGIQR